MTTLLKHEQSDAKVRDPIVFAQLNTSVELSCDSNGLPLQLCFWEQRLDRQSRVINIGDDASQSDGNTSAVGFAKGTCALKIQAFAVNDTGPWFCTLITQNGGKFTGVVVLGELPFYNL